MQLFGLLTALVSARSPEHLGGFTHTNEIPVKIYWMGAYTLKNLGTLTGNAAATLMVVNVVQHVSGWYERWFALVVAVVVSLCTAMMVKATKNMGFFCVAFLQGFLTYATAFGVQNTVVTEEKPPEVVVVAPTPPRPPPTIFFNRPPSVNELPSAPPAAPPVKEERTFRSGW